MSRQDDKSAYTEKMKAKLDEWDAEIQKLEAKARQAEADARLEYEDEVRELKQKRSETRAKLDELGQAGGQAWSDMQSGVESAFDDLSAALDRARKRFG